MYVRMEEVRRGCRRLEKARRGWSQPFQIGRLPFDKEKARLVRVGGGYMSSGEVCLRL